MSAEFPALEGPPPRPGRCPHTWQSRVRGARGLVLACDTPRTLNFRRSQVTKSGPDAPGIEATIHSSRSRVRRNRRRYLTTPGRNRRKAIIVRGSSRQCDKKQSRLIRSSPKEILPAPLGETSAKGSIGGDTLGTFLRVNLSSVIDVKNEVLLFGTQRRSRFDGILTTFSFSLPTGLRRFL